MNALILAIPFEPVAFPVSSLTNNHSRIVHIIILSCLLVCKSVPVCIPERGRVMSNDIFFQTALTITPGNLNSQKSSTIDASDVPSTFPFAFPFPPFRSRSLRTCTPSTGHNGKPLLCGRWPFNLSTKLPVSHS